MKLLVDLYPGLADLSLFYEMPWVFNAAWRIIKMMLPTSILETTKFVNRTQLTEYIDDDNRLASWGGKDQYKYSFQQEG